MFTLRCKSSDAEAETPTERFFSTSAMFLIDRMKEDRSATMDESIGLTTMTAFLDTISNVAFIYDIQAKSFGENKTTTVSEFWSIIMVSAFWFCIIGQTIASTAIIYAFFKEKKEMEIEVTFRFESKNVAMVALCTDVILEFMILVISGVLFYIFDL